MQNKYFDEDGHLIEVEDPFQHTAMVRLIVVKHNFSYNFHGPTENCTYITFVEAFEFGFKNRPIKSDKPRPVRDWVSVDVRDSCDRQVNHLMKDMTNGIYEVTADFFHWESRSYEGEYEGECELRNIKIQEIRFGDAIKYGGDQCSLHEEIEYLHLNKPDIIHFNPEFDIHHYMPLKHILQNHINVLGYLIDQTRTYDSHQKAEKLSVEALEDTIHMMMLQLDSNSLNRPEVWKRAQEIDAMVDACIKRHNRLMNADS